MRKSRNNMEIHGQCSKCQGPIFLNSSMDWYGNTVLSLNCWNGHYQWINIENIEESKNLAPETRRDLVAHIGFFDLSLTLGTPGWDAYLHSSFFLRSFFFTLPHKPSLNLLRE